MNTPSLVHSLSPEGSHARATGQRGCSATAEGKLRQGAEEEHTLESKTACQEQTSSTSPCCLFPSALVRLRPARLVSWQAASCQPPHSPPSPGTPNMTYPRAIPPCAPPNRLMG